MKKLPFESAHENIDPTKPYLLGIDEAGRGPVLGPMVYACSYCPIEKTDALNKAGYMDSKQLTQEQRTHLFQKIIETPYLEFLVDIIMPEDLSAKMCRISKINLNQISHDSAIGLIQRALAKHVNITQVFVDTVGTPETYQGLLQRHFPSLQIKVSKKADSIYPIVSAASICAKVTRDHCIHQWEFVETGKTLGRKFGSGYPGDPVTRAWLADHLDCVFGFPSIVRFSWKTCETLLKRKAVEVEWNEQEREETEKEKSAMQQKLSFTNHKKQRTKFFEEGNIHMVSDLL